MQHLKFIAFSVILTCGSSLKPAIAQSITAADGGTSINIVGNQTDITGTQVSGINQFHSFTNFNVDAGKSANFIPNNATIQNILSRVTGGTPSQIQGIIQGSSGVNLFLMNPSGILFGNGASLNVPGSFTATTANAIGFGNNNWFNAAGNNNFANLTNTPNQFAFTSANPGAIVNTGNLAVPSSNSINLVGGTVINTGTIATSGGNITIAAVEGGKAVQITPGNSLLSYVLPIDALNAINPAIGNPVSLPELLTGSPLDSASGIEVKNGVVTLVKSQTPLPNKGLVVVGGTINSAGNPTSGKVEVVGGTIAVTNPSFDTSSGFSDKTFIQFRASDRIVFGDLGGNPLEFGKAVDFLTMQTTSPSGIVESLNPKDSIVIPRGIINIDTTSVNVGNLLSSYSNFDDTINTTLNITATKDITTGDLIAANNGSGTESISVLTKTGNIKTGKIDAQNRSSPIKLVAEIGNIEVDSVSAGTYGGPEKVTALDIFAGGTFRVIGTQSDAPIFPDSYSYSLKNADNQVFDFLASKTNKTPTELRSTTFERFYVLAPISISTRNNSDIRIRYAGGQGAEIMPLPGVTIQGGDSRFEVGAKVTVGTGEAYLPIDPTKTFDTFFESPFDIRQNVTYSRTILAEGRSGTVGAIVRYIKTDGTLNIGLQDQAFGVLPTKPIEPVITKPIEPQSIDSTTPSDPTTQKPNTANISTIDLENRTTSTLTACSKSQTIAVLTEASRSPDSPTPKSTAKNPCIPDNSDDEILKILK